MLTFFNSFEFSLYKLLFFCSHVCVCVGQLPRKTKVNFVFVDLEEEEDAKVNHPFTLN